MSEKTVQPYPGARPFRQSEQDLFFGREDEAAKLAEYWLDNRLVFVVGQAGCGKTSLINAGVLPLLANRKAAVLPVGQLSYGATSPFAALPPYNPYTLGLLRSWSPGETSTRLAGQTIREYFEHWPDDRTVLAAIDPADELLADTGSRRIHRQRFLREIADALDAVPRLHLLIAGREEAAGVLAGTLGGGIRYEVSPLTWQGATEAVSQPAAWAGRSYADGAAERLLTDLATTRRFRSDGTEHFVTDDRVHPVLMQIVCARLWDELPPGHDIITPQDVNRHADVDAALTAYFSAVVAEVADDHGLSSKRLRAWLLSEFITERGTLGNAYEGVSTTAGMPNAVARALEDRHLLAARPQSGGRWYELLCDRLIQPLRELDDARPAPGPPEDHLRAAERALTLGDLDLAERHALEVTRRPEEAGHRLLAEAYSLLGNVSYEREKPEEAEERYRKAMEHSDATRNSRAVALQLASVAQTLLAQGHVSAAAEALRAAASRMPNDLVIRVAHALTLWYLGAARAAAAELTVALGIDGANAAALRARGEILADIGEAREAMLDLDRVSAQGRPQIRAARGLALAQLGDLQAARREIDAAVGEARHNGPVLLYAARAFALGGDESTASELARQAANATDPPLSPAHRTLARQLVESGPRVSP
jgi:tetratricopeptide (TPR) repeat protein